MKLFFIGDLCVIYVLSIGSPLGYRYYCFFNGFISPHDGIENSVTRFVTRFILEIFPVGEFDFSMRGGEGRDKEKNK